MTPKYRLSDREQNTCNHPTKFLIRSFHKEKNVNEFIICITYPTVVLNQQIIWLEYFPTNAVRKYRLHNEYKNSYMFRHPGAIFRDLLYQGWLSQPDNLCFVHSYKLN